MPHQYKPKGLLGKTAQACKAGLYTSAAAVAAKAAGVAALHVAGFGQAGVAAGSVAAGMQATIGNVAAGKGKERSRCCNCDCIKAYFKHGCSKQYPQVLSAAAVPWCHSLC
jgi:hypothetical protein